jgi:hypothetical protein
VAWTPLLLTDVDAGLYCDFSCGCDFYCGSCFCCVPSLQCTFTLEPWIITASRGHTNNNLIVDRRRLVQTGLMDLHWQHAAAGPLGRSARRKSVPSATADVVNMVGLIDNLFPETYSQGLDDGINSETPSECCHTLKAHQERQHSVRQAAHSALSICEKCVHLT